MSFTPPFRDMADGEEMKIRLDPLDKVFSEYVRRRAVARVGGCELCGKVVGWKRLECSHFYGRRMKSVRWHPDNAAGLCFTCHRKMTENPRQHDIFFQERLGVERFERLYLQANMTIKLCAFDKQVIEADLKEKIKELEGK